MCGIAGSTSTSPAMLKAYCARLAHRGPDDAGVWIDRDVGLAHTRLAIIDLSSGGHQPMVGSDRYVIAYNGEIFNYRELRAELEARGEQFRTESDTEVLLALLARGGVEGLGRVSGMFALALWDRQERKLLLARDRLGIKPLVYAELSGRHIAFASEIETLLADPAVGREIDFAAVSEYLACLYVPAPRTARKAIRKLPPGHFLLWQEGGFRVSRWWSPSLSGSRTPSVDEAAEEILPVLRRAVAQHMVADVPVGCFLSGGIDSSLVAALMAEHAHRQGAPPVRTFTMTFQEQAYDERDAARRVAQAVGSVHVELPASATAVESRLGPMLQRFGEPFGNPTALLIDDLATQARQHVKVAMVGDGGDEVFAGYPRYMGGVLARRYRKLPRWLRTQLLAPLSGLIPESAAGRHFGRRAREFLLGANESDDRMYAGWVEYFSPKERAELLGLDEVPLSPIQALYRAVETADPLDSMQTTDLLSFLPGNLLAYGDAMSMAHALELRLPLLDYRLIERIGTLSASLRVARGQKTLLRAIAARFLPPEIVKLPKRGFNPPMGVWLQTTLSSLVADSLSSSRLAAIGINPKPVQLLLNEHRAGRRDHALKIWGLLVLERWASGALAGTAPA